MQISADTASPMRSIGLEGAGQPLVGKLRPQVPGSEVTRAKPTRPAMAVAQTANRWAPKMPLPSSSRASTSAISASAAAANAVTQTTTSTRLSQVRNTCAACIGHNSGTQRAAGGPVCFR
jgi:hypothetical protein